jgi:hypothetical protein
LNVVTGRITLIRINEEFSVDIVYIAIPYFDIQHVFDIDSIITNVMNGGIQDSVACCRCNDPYAPFTAVDNAVVDKVVRRNCGPIAINQDT